MKIIVAIDSFKGCLSSLEANKASAEGILNRFPSAEVVQIPVSDGGEGWLDACGNAIGGEIVDIIVRDPMMRRVKSHYLIKGDTAVIEIAQASGLTLVEPQLRNPLVATSYGTGEIVADAVRRGCRNIIVGLGGSATSDCGIGMLRALIDSFAKGGSWKDVHAIDGVNFTIATDVTNPLCGVNGAAHVFAPQKGATPNMVEVLDNRARQFADFSAKSFGFDKRDVPGAGAAGGLGYAFLQYMNASCCSGVELLFKYLHFDEHLSDASLVITGEGSADRQTLMGKLPFGILSRAKAFNVPVALVSGKLKDRQLLHDAGFTYIRCINNLDLPLEEALKPEVAKQNIRNSMAYCLDML